MPLGILLDGDKPRAVKNDDKASLAYRSGLFSRSAARTRLLLQYVMGLYEVLAEGEGEGGFPARED